MSEQFGIGVVGAGFIVTESHVPSVEYVRDARVAAIANPTRSRAEAVAEQCRERGVGDPALYAADEVAAMAADPAVDGLWVTSPNHTRVGVVEQAVDAVDDGADLAGVAMEKPVARDLAETERVLDLIEGAGLAHAYLENWPHEPDIRELRAVLWERGRDAGRPYLARSQAEHGGPHSAWFWDGTKQGGGALTDMLCHALSSNEVLLSDPEGGELTPTEVTADTETLKWARPEYADRLREEYGVDYAENPAEDYARATVRYEDGDGNPVVSEATGSWCYVGAGVRRTVELLGPEYSGRVAGDGDSVFLADGVAASEGWAEKQTATSGRLPLGGGGVFDGGYVAENRDAVRAFERGENGELDLRDGRAVMELCMAAYRSAETGGAVAPGDDLVGYTPPPARE